MAILLFFWACRPDVSDTGTVWDRGPNPHALDDVLRLNHIQTKGSHNSYHLEPETVYDDSHRYSHPTLTEQLDLQVRQLELDLHLTEDGEWQVFHLPSIDAETTCLAFSSCLGEIKDWSDDNGWHLPITVWLEPKDDLDAVAEGLVSIGDAIASVDDEIRQVFPDARLLTPDDLRGDAASISAGLSASGWPLLGEVRGRVIFALLDTGSHRTSYLQGAPDLAGRVLFVDGTPQEPITAFIKDGSAAEIADWSAAGFMVTSNGSTAGDGADGQQQDAALLEAGTHHIATDFTAPIGDAYWLDLTPRCNPVAAPASCADEELERL